LSVEIENNRFVTTAWDSLARHFANNDLSDLLRNRLLKNGLIFELELL